MRLWLLSALLVALVGTGAELLLVGHVEDSWQLAPLGLIASCLVILTWHAVAPGAASIRIFQAVMVLFLLAGGVGLGLHWQAKVEFKSEMDPSLSGIQLWWEAMKSQSPPALAPAIMIQIALLGMAYTYRHPALGSKPKRGSSTAV
jgi:hypothetical protein